MVERFWYILSPQQDRLRTERWLVPHRRGLRWAGGTKGLRSKQTLCSVICHVSSILQGVWQWDLYDSGSLETGLPAQNLYFLTLWPWARHWTFLGFIIPSRNGQNRPCVFGHSFIVESPWEELGFFILKARTKRDKFKLFSKRTWFDSCNWKAQGVDMAAEMI